MGMRYQDGMIGITRQDVHQHTATLRTLSFGFCAVGILLSTLGLLVIVLLMG